MLNLFRRVAWLEGVSLLLLLFVAMPLKYRWGLPQAVRLVGMTHGLLFLAYVALLFRIGIELRWSGKTLFLGFVTSSLPFGTFWFDKRYLAR
jgi:integral membrane protein